ncbi:hypothetical protein DM48_6770 [Burkholderia gladioli]|uniref:Uncharacterized protein n=1 Tax=Burkholderia gladioli TaxID=28095 RepID=A0AAW3EV58_BURGA|nr:hypothetical protein [Burkholderia gladioli]KGC10740.1 hypothetical protein DM48_6770 [Burkholderia gladioli]
MSRQQASSMARRQAAASIAWPQGTLILVNPDPAARRALAWLLIAFLFAALVVAITGQNGPMSQWLRHVESRDTRPAMQAAMERGNRAAGTWLAVRFPTDYPGLLDTEAQAGDPTAMYLVARRQLAQRDNTSGAVLPAHGAPAATGVDLMLKAAAAGSQDALRYVIDHPNAIYQASGPQAPSPHANRD